jgi:hypothetical protein
MLLCGRGAVRLRKLHSGSHPFKLHCHPSPPGAHMLSATGGKGANDLAYSTLVAAGLSRRARQHAGGFHRG